MSNNDGKKYVDMFDMRDGSMKQKKKKSVVQSTSLLCKELSLLLQEAAVVVAPAAALRETGVDGGKSGRRDGSTSSGGEEARGGEETGQAAPAWRLLKELDQHDIPELVDRSLLSVTEGDVCWISDGMTFYPQALALFMDGCVTEKHAAGNRLAALVRDKGNIYHDTWVEVRRQGKGLHFMMSCDCNYIRKYNTCMHTMALLLAWVRKKASFKIQPAQPRHHVQHGRGTDGGGDGHVGSGGLFDPGYVALIAAEARMDAAAGRIFKLLDDVVTGLETSGKLEDLDVVQRLQSLAKSYWRAHDGLPQDAAVQTNAELLEKLSGLFAIVYSAVLTHIGAKYSIPAMGFYYQNLARTMDVVTERFLDTPGGGRQAAASCSGVAVTGAAPLHSHSGTGLRVDSQVPGGGSPAKAAVAAPPTAAAAAARTTKHPGDSAASRSWDSIIDGLSGSSGG